MCGGVRSIAARREARSIAGAHGGTDADGGQPCLQGALADGAKRLLEVLVDVGAQRLQGRDVEDPHLVLEPALEPFAQQLVDGVQEGGQRLPGPGRSGQQGVPAFADGGPCALLGGKRRPQRLGEPFPDDRVEGQPRHLIDYDPVALAPAVAADQSRARSHDVHASEVEVLLLPERHVPLCPERRHRLLRESRLDL